MAVLWLVGGILMLAVGQWSVNKGIMSIAGEKPLLLTILMLVLGQAGLLIAAAATASVEHQSAFLLMFILAVGVYDVLLFHGLLGIMRPFECIPAVMMRECVIVILTLCYLIVVGWSTFGTGHPDVWLGRKDGMLFLLLFAGEILWLLLTSMNGYRLLKKEQGLPRLYGSFVGVIGICLAICGGYLLAVSVGEISLLGGLHPAFFGFFPAGLLLGAGCFLRGWKENRSGGARTMSALWGASSLALTGGLGVACLAGPVCLSFPVVLLSFFGCAALAVYEIRVLQKGLVGRGLSLFLLAVYAAAGLAIVLILL